jgi:hypothetical protein
LKWLPLEQLHVLDWAAADLPVLVLLCHISHRLAVCMQSQWTPVFAGA